MYKRIQVKVIRISERKRLNEKRAPSLDILFNGLLILKLESLEGSDTPRLKKIAVFENTPKKWFVGSFYTHPLRQKSWFSKISHERILRKSAKLIFLIFT